MVNRLLFLASWRFFKRHPWQLWLTLLSIALGTAVIVAVDLANATARASFRSSVTELTGPMSHELKARQGYLDEALYRQWRLEGLGVTVPEVRTDVQLAGRGLTFLGIDPLASPLETSGQWSLPEAAITRLISEPGSVIVSPSLAIELGLSVGDMFEVQVNGEARRLMLLALMQGQVPAQLNDVILGDISTGQGLIGIDRGLTAVQMQLTEEAAATLEASLPANVLMKYHAGERQSFEEMTEAFRVNLMAMSLLAMLVGAFLVYNTMTFSVLQRRQSFAVARMVGVTPRQLFLQLLLDALMLGLMGSLLGVLLGWVLGQGLLVLVTRTINDLYVPLSSGALAFTPGLLIKGVGITLLAVLAATLAPAWEAARVQPVSVQRVSTLESGTTGLARVLFGAGVLLLLASMAVSNFAGTGLLVGFFGLFLFIVGYSLLIPFVLRLILGWLERLSGRASMLVRMAVRGVRSSLSRTSLAIIALSVAVAATIGVSIMIGSFRASVADWLETTLSSDLYVSALAGNESRVDGTLERFWLDEVTDLPELTSYSTGRSLRMSVEGRQLPALVIQPGEHSARGFDYMDGDPEAIWQAFGQGRGVLVSEPMAYHRSLQVGDDIEISTPHAGDKRFRVIGIYRDYSSGQGMLVMPRPLYEQYWDDQAISSIGMVFDSPSALAAAKQRLLPLTAGSGDAVVVRSNLDIREHSLAVFDRTFAITQVLRILVIIVAFVGVFSALMALFLERGREFAILRATGLTPPQVSRLIGMQSLLIGVMAGLLALPLGWALSDILIEVINRRSFGWSMQRQFFWSIPLEAMVLSIVAAMLASWWPARRIARMNVRQGLQP